MSTTIRYTETPAVATITLHRPERLNAMTASMCREVQDALRRVDRSDVGALVLRGSGRAFCSGADLEAIVSDVDITDEAAVRRFMVEGWQRVIAMLRHLRVPTVAAVQGAAFGGGANLALACDLVVAAESAVFCQAYVDRGIPPDLGATWILPRLVGPQQARRLLLTGARVGAADALAMGMVSEVVADEVLGEHVDDLAAMLAAKDSGAVERIRGLLEANAHAPLADALDREADAIAEFLGRSEFRDAIAPYLDR